MSEETQGLTEEQEEAPRRRRSRRVPVRVVELRGESAVVEIVGDAPQRKVVLKSLIEEDGVEQEELNKSPDYGAPWAEITRKSKVLTEEGRADLEANLRRAGIWTPEDLRMNTNSYLQVMAATLVSETRAMLEHKEVS